MNKLKIAGIVAVLFLLVGLVNIVQAEAKVSMSRYVGTYVSEYDSSHTIELKPDGTFVALTNGKVSNQGTYEIKRGETYKIEGKTYEVVGDTLIFYWSGGSASYSINDEYFGVEPDRKIKQGVPTGEEKGIPTGEEKGIPGFEAMSAVAGLLAVAYLLRRKK